MLTQAFKCFSKPSSCSDTQGFRAADLRQHLAALSGRDLAVITPGAVTYQLRRLRLHGLIERTPNSFRYCVTDLGWRVGLFFTRTYNRLLRPGLAAALPALRAIATPLRTALDRFTEKIDAITTEAQLAAQNLTLLRQASFVKRGLEKEVHIASDVARGLQWRDKP